MTVTFDLAMAACLIAMIAATIPVTRQIIQAYADGWKHMGLSFIVGAVVIAALGVSTSALWI